MAAILSGCRADEGVGERAALADAGLKATDIDLLIVATITPDVTMPASACLIQNLLGVPTTARRTVEINEYLETSFPNIFAAGDVAGPYQFTHTASHQAWYAAVNALFGRFRKFKADYSVIPWVTFTEPEVARVGLNEREARDKKIKAHVHAAKLGRKFRYDNGKIRQQGLGTSVDKHIGRMVMRGEPQDAIKKYATTEEVEVEESFADEHGIGRDIADKKQKMATASNTGKGKPLHNVAKGLKAFLQGRKEPMESVEVDGEILDEKASTDMLRGRVYQDKPEHNAHKPSKIDLGDAGEELPKGKIQQPQSTRARSSIDAHEGIPTKVDNLDPHYGTPNSFAVHTEAKDPETSDAFGGQANFVTNGQTSSDEPKKKELSEVSVDEKVIAGTPGWVKSPGKDGVVTDKSGAKHTPMSRAKDLARQAFKKVQQETLGSAPNNQTGV